MSGGPGLHGEVIWRDPPTATEVRRPGFVLEGPAAKLRAHPGEWGIVERFDLGDSEKTSRKASNQARAMAMNIRIGRYKVFRPAGAFGARAVTEVLLDSKGKPVRDEQGNPVKVVNVYAVFNGRDAG